MTNKKQIKHEIVMVHAHQNIASPKKTKAKTISGLIQYWQNELLTAQNGSSRKSFIERQIKKLQTPEGTSHDNHVRSKRVGNKSRIHKNSAKNIPKRTETKS